MVVINKYFTIFNTMRSAVRVSLCVFAALGTADPVGYRPIAESCATTGRSSPRGICCVFNKQRRGKTEVRGRRAQGGKRKGKN